MKAKPMPLPGNTEEEGNITGLRIFPGAWGVSCILGTPSLESDTRKMSPLKWFEKQWDIIKGCGKPRLHQWRTHTQPCFLPGIALRKQIENCLRPWPIFWNCQSTHHSPYWHLPQLLLLQCCSPLERGAIVKESVQIRGNWTSLELTLRVYGPGLWDPSPSPIKQWWPLNREALTHTWLWLEPLHLQPHLPARWELPEHLREKETHANFRSSFPIKATGHIQTA